MASAKDDASENSGDDAKTVIRGRQSPSILQETPPSKLVEETRHSAKFDYTQDSSQLVPSHLKVLDSR